MQDEKELPVILVADDDHDDQELIMECLEKIKSPVKVEIVGNGQLALERLQNSHLPHPCLVVLDINMPYLNGIETLQRIRTEPSLKNIPVVMFTTADNEDSRKKALSLGANDYFVKAGDFGEWLNHAGKMVKYCA
jgi:CheY-like chemotaxis protein